MDAVVTAGGIPAPEDALYPYSQGRSKSLIDIGGKPMVQWVLDALAGASRVQRVVVVGLDESSGVTCGDKALAFLPNQGEMIPNIEAGVRRIAADEPKTDKVLLVSSDIPLIRTEMVDWAIDAVKDTDRDLYYSVVEKSVMERRFPGSKRTYITTKDAVVCGADLNVVGARAVLDNRARELWAKVVESRKNALKQAQLIGFDLLFLLLTRQVTLEYAEQHIGRKLGIKGRIMLCPYAEPGMDVDKPRQLEMVRGEIEKGAVMA